MSVVLSVYNITTDPYALASGVPSMTRVTSVTGVTAAGRAFWLLMKYLNRFEAFGGTASSPSVRNFFFMYYYLTAIAGSQVDFLALPGTQAAVNGSCTVCLPSLKFMYQFIFSTKI